MSIGLHSFGLTRPVLALYAVFFCVLAWFSDAFWPMKASNAAVMRVVLFGVALLCVVTAWLTREVPRWIQRLAVASVVFGAGPLMLWMHGASYVTGAIVSPTPAIATFAVELVGLLSCLVWGRRRSEARPLLAVIGGGLLFMGCFIFIPVTMWMWQPPDLAVCDAAAEQEHVQRLSPAAWSQQPSQPYSLLYVPDKRWLFAAFKMGGNGILSFWNDPTANRVFGVDTENTGTTAELPFPGKRIPSYMAYTSDGDVLLSRQARGLDAFDFISLEALPKLSVSHSVDVDFETHAVVASHSLPFFGLITADGEYLAAMGKELSVADRFQLVPGRIWSTAPLDAWQRPGTPLVYVSLMLGGLLELDLEVGFVRSSPAMFGGGLLIGSADGESIIATDLVFNRVDILDRGSLSVTRHLDLEYTPRPVALDEGRDLLMVGDWFNGEVRLYRYSTLEPLPQRLSVGPYLRGFAYNAERGLLYTASKCGVYEVEVASTASEGGE